MKIFVCEDDQSILTLMELLLKQEGYEVLCTTETNNIVESINEFNPNLIILDYWLDNIKADFIINRLRNDSVHRFTPIVLISAIHNLPQLADELGVDDYIEKPFNISDFLDTINGLDDGQ